MERSTLNQNNNGGRIDMPEARTGPGKSCCCFWRSTARNDQSNFPDKPETPTVPHSNKGRVVPVSTQILVNKDNKSPKPIIKGRSNDSNHHSDKTSKYDTNSSSYRTHDTPVSWPIPTKINPGLNDSTDSPFIQKN
jgi:hypothetical protein